MKNNKWIKNKYLELKNTDDNKKRKKLTLDIYKMYYDKENYESDDYDPDREIWYLMQDLNYYLNDLASVWLLNMSNKEDYIDDDSDEEEKKELKKEYDAYFKKILDFYSFLYHIPIDKEDIEKKLFDDVENYYYERSEVNSGAIPWCDCGCGGDFIDFDWGYKYLDQNINILYLSIYFNSLKFKK